MKAVLIALLFLACAGECLAAVAESPVAPSQALEDAKRAVRLRDYKKAFNFFTDAARQGNAQAQFNLAMMYESGRGTPADRDAALSWYKAAALLKYAPAIEKIDELKKQGEDIRRNPDASKEEQLLAAIRENSADDVSRLLGAGVNINYQDKYGQTALIVAVEAGPDSLDLVRRLVAKGAGLEAQGKDGRNALLTATLRKNIEAARFLLGSGALVDAADAQGVTALMLAAQLDDAAMVNLLIEKKADPKKVNAAGHGALEIALLKKHDDIARLLLATGKVALPPQFKDPDAVKAVAARLKDMKEANKGTPFEKWTPLMLASWRGEKEIVVLLLSQGEAVDTLSDDGYTALSRAAWQGHADIVELLLKAGAKSDAVPDQAKASPLILAAANGHEEALARLIASSGYAPARAAIFKAALAAAVKNGHGAAAKCLLEAGVPLGSSEAGGSPLLSAAASGDVNLIEIFLDHQADVNGADSTGRTALMIAAENGQADAVKVLLARHAALDAQNNDGYSALSFAARAGKADAAALLLAAGSRVDLVGIRGDTPLILAADAGAGEVARLLLEHKASVDMANKAGDTPLLIAVKRDDRAMAALFLEHGANPYLSVKTVDNSSEAMRALLDKHKSVKNWLMKLL
ncbi:MAG: ankyrin repeat domain-containing protein [Candidatus Omnitrophota bacterium]